MSQCMSSRSLLVLKCNLDNNTRWCVLVLHRPTLPLPLPLRGRACLRRNLYCCHSCQMFLALVGHCQPCEGVQCQARFVSACMACTPPPLTHSVWHACDIPCWHSTVCQTVPPKANPEDPITFQPLACMLLLDKTAKAQDLRQLGAWEHLSQDWACTAPPGLRHHAT